MSNVLGSIFGFGNKMKRRLRDAVSNPLDYLEMTADENQNEWRKNPDERSMGFFNPVPLGSMSPFLLRKEMKAAIDELPNLSRRDFMKKSGGLAAGSAIGAGVTAKLLRKFAPEERAVAKQVAVEAAPKYKYNSLKEYLDDVGGQAARHADEFPGGVIKSPQDLMKQRLLQDEAEHEASKFFYKDNLKDPSTGKWIDPFSGKPHGDEFLKNISNTKDYFSPQAKMEMNHLKYTYGDEWTNPFALSTLP